MAIVHCVAQAGFGASTADLYDRARPSYPTEALDFIRKNVATEGLLNIVEFVISVALVLAAALIQTRIASESGTGIFTRALLADPSWNTRIKEIKAVEPSQGMRNQFSKTVGDDRITLSDGVFHCTGVEEGWADLVVVAQAFHWCPDFAAASSEFSRILKPQGFAAFLWNLENRQALFLDARNFQITSSNRDAAKWVGQVRDIIETYEQGTPQFRRMLWKETFDTISYKKFFKPPEEKTWDYVLETTKKSVIDRALSKSYIAILPDDTKMQVKMDIVNVIDRADKVWIDESKGIFEYPYTTWVVVSRKE